MLRGLRFERASVNKEENKWIAMAFPPTSLFSIRAASTLEERWRTIKGMGFGFGALASRAVYAAKQSKARRWNEAQPAEEAAEPETDEILERDSASPRNEPRLLKTTTASAEQPRPAWPGGRLAFSPTTAPNGRLLLRPDARFCSGVDSDLKRGAGRYNASQRAVAPMQGSARRSATWPRASSS